MRKVPGWWSGRRGSKRTWTQISVQFSACLHEAKQVGVLALSDEGMLATAEESGPRKYTLRVGRASTGEVHPSVRERFCAVICLTCVSRGLLGAADMRLINALMCLGGCEVQLCGF